MSVEHHKISGVFSYLTDFSDNIHVYDGSIGVVIRRKQVVRQVRLEPLVLSENNTNELSNI